MDSEPQPEPIADARVDALMAERNEIQSAILGGPVSDAAAEAFPVVRDALDLRDERDALHTEAVELREAMREVAAELDKQGAPHDQRLHVRIRAWARAIRASQECADAATVQAIAKARATGRRRLPDERDSKTLKFSVDGHEGYLTASAFEDGKLGEIFLRMAHAGQFRDGNEAASFVDGIMSCFAIAVSIGLQYGAPLGVFMEKFEHQNFAPQGMTGNKEIPFAKSVIDLVFKWLRRFLPATEGTP